MEAWLARAAREHGSRIALSTPNEAGGAGGTRLTYAELFAASRRAAGGLRDAGIGRGDRVALALGSELLVVALHACLLIGATAVPVDLRLTAGEQALRTDGAALVLEALPDGDPVTPVATALSAPATVMFTSGTTASPKEIVLSHDNWLGNAIGSALALGLDRDERWLCPMPLAHVGGLSIQLRSVVYGTEVLLHGRYETEAVRDALMDPGAGVTLASLVPTMLVRLLDAGLTRPPALRWILLGGGPIAPALLQRAVAAGVPVAPSYGMTEACSQIATHGWPLLGTELRLGPGDEVLVRGRTVARGALGADGWLHTGDRGRMDPGGRLEIVGRIAETIVSGGENIAPTEVEAVLLEHPAVADAAVLGRGDAEWGEAVVARYVLVGGATDPGEAELRAHCARRLAAFKVPKRFEAVTALPRSATGKLLRRELV
jgi:O-succinylbenzoic acid--CoA ligase